MGEQEERLVGFLGGWDAKDVDEDEADNSVSEDSDNEADDGIKDGVFRVGDFLAVAAGDDVADTAPDEHDDRKGADDGEGDAGELSEDTVVADKFGRHTFGAGDLSTFLDGESHSFAGAKRQAGADAGDDL